MNNTNIYVNIIMFIILFIYFKKLIGNFINAHITNKPLLLGSRYLREMTDNLDIKATILENSSRSSQYTYNLWLFLENISRENIDSFSNIKKIFSHNDNGNKETFSLSYDYTTSELIVNYSPKDTITVPQQKWVNISINLNVNMMDIYLDGKMVKSVKLETIPLTPGGIISLKCRSCSDTKLDKTSGIYGYIDIFRYFNEYLTPEKVEDIYLSGLPDKNNNPSDNTFWWY